MTPEQLNLLVNLGQAVSYLLRQRKKHHQKKGKNDKADEAHVIIEMLNKSISDVNIQNHVNLSKYFTGD